MLTLLHIKNIALIEDIFINLGEGLNILSGETGAGKSIIIDSLNFVLGERADKTLIRYGAESASVDATFEHYLTPSVSEYLTAIGIDAEEVLLLRRVMSTAGKNECRINGQPVTLGMLKGLTELIADIHGQHEHQSLLKTSTHIRLLDAFGGLEIAAAKNAVKLAHTEYKSLLAEYARFGNPEERAKRIDILSYQVEELERAALVPGEEDFLLAERKKFRNIEKIVNAMNDCVTLLNGGDSHTALSTLNKAKNSLKTAVDYDERLSDLFERLDAAKIELKDIAETLADKLTDIQYDDYTAEKVEERLELVRSLTRKYGGSIDALIIFFNSAKNELETLCNSDELCVALENKIHKQCSALMAFSDKLSKLRKNSAKRFEKEIDAQLAELGMGGARFKVSFNNPEKVLPEDCGADGYDNVEFLISANVGEPEKPLAKIISGGEMSRFMLALKNIVARLDNITTMVFDEIDTGISGNIAQVVAEKLYNISHDRQVIAVTHLPQLASMADLHYKIEKSVSDDKTTTHLTLLDEEGEINEIARLIGGSGYSEHAIPHALEMKLHSNAYKK